MARIISTGDTAAKRRHRHMRSCAEVLRLLAQRPTMDVEEKDMVAFLVFSLRSIYETIEESAQSWDDKNYWKKAENLREKWRWSRTASDKLKKMVLKDKWDEIPIFLINLVPHFSQITIVSITRDSDWWVGALTALRKESQPAS